MQTKKLTTEEISRLRLSPIAEKHSCSADYVKKVLKGIRERNSDTAKSIVQDAVDMLAIVERKTKIEV
jgi:hypothetical protein